MSSGRHLTFDTPCGWACFNTPRRAVPFTRARQQAATSTPCWWYATYAIPPVLNHGADSARAPSNAIHPLWLRGRASSVHQKKQAVHHQIQLMPALPLLALDRTGGFRVLGKCRCLGSTDTRGDLTQEGTCLRVFPTGRHSGVILARAPQGPWDLIVCRGHSRPQVPCVRLRSHVLFAMGWVQVLFLFQLMLSRTGNHGYKGRLGGLAKKEMPGALERSARQCILACMCSTCREGYCGSF